MVMSLPMSAGLELGELQSAFPTQTILWFYDFKYELSWIVWIKSMGFNAAISIFF